MDRGWDFRKRGLNFNSIQMKKLICILLISLSFGVFGQKYITKTGTLDFEASVPAFEPVKAQHATTTAILDVTKGNVAVLALVKGFRFKNALMEEHFNENYMESDRFPKASFSGAIIGFNQNNLSTEKEYKAKGRLTIHGETREIEIPIILFKEGGIITMKTKFNAVPEDFGIKVPGVVKGKISESINILGRFDLAQR